MTINRKQFSKILEQFPETTKLSLKALLKELHQWERKNIHEAAAMLPQQNRGDRPIEYEDLFPDK